MNPFRHPPLLAGLATARDEPRQHAAQLLISADYCDDSGDAALARGLRLLAEHQMRPAFDAKRNTWRWEKGWEEAAGRASFTPGDVPGRCWRLHPGLYEALAGHNYETWKQYTLTPEFSRDPADPGDFGKHYSTFALAVIDLARLLAEPRQAALPTGSNAPALPEPQREV